MGLYIGLLWLWTPYLVPFARYAATEISISGPDLSGSPKVKYFTFIGNPIWDFIMMFCWQKTLYLVPFAEYSASKISVSDLDLSRSPKVKYFTVFGMLIWDFIKVSCWYELSISYRLRDMPHLRFLDLSGSPKVKYFTFFGRPIWDFIMMFCIYKLSISYHFSYCLQDILHLRYRLVDLTFQGHSKSNILTFLQSQYGNL